MPVFDSFKFLHLDAEILLDQNVTFDQLLARTLSSHAYDLGKLVIGEMKFEQSSYIPGVTKHIHGSGFFVNREDLALMLQSFSRMDLHTRGEVVKVLLHAIEGKRQELDITEAMKLLK